MTIWRKALPWLITFLIPIALTFLGIRLVLTHAFPEIEYRLPGFPKDDYGFTLQERVQWSKVSFDFVQNSSDISFLANLTFPDGSSLFNERELGHMQDVKNVIRPVLWIGYGIWFLLAGLGLWAWFGGWRKEYLSGLRRGGWWTVGLVAVIGIVAASGFWQFFTVFHEIFFKGDSWLFLYSDTLIRLFPLRFWQDAFLFVGLLDFFCGLLIGMLLKDRKGVNTVVI